MFANGVCTQRNQQKLVYKGKCYTLKQKNCNNKCWICASEMRRCRGKLYTNLDATQVIQMHADDPHALYHQQQLNKLKRLAAGNLTPILPLTFHRGTRPETPCATAWPEQTHDFQPGGRICGSLPSEQQQNPVRNF
ncbi:hypothetical protein T4D_15604 [Trichinella pseudospiralis]|uniref:FLYWCH-type domain-containing protein n=1 Tax=Trichinella pseudospiralis TaxID=6337 RepID=A0A0V1FEK5_TRIPS|nr:hypothetical protein T4D_15604 [Trichinella pseudospiralis]